MMGSSSSICVLIFLIGIFSITWALPSEMAGCEKAEPRSTSKAGPWEENYRIPEDTLPIHYDLYMYPNLETDKFSGHVTIEIDAKQPRDHFLAHIKYLNVTSSSLTDDQGEDILIKEAFEFAANEFWVVQLDSEVPVGKYFLKLEFTGPLDNGILGFYKSVYVDSNGKERAIATSKFQPTYARRAFPCFDEPSFKSTFNITVVRPSEGYIALSNMPETTSTPDSPSVGLTEVSFEKSVPMVTYLAIFIVCDFKYIESATPEYNIPFRVYGTEDNQALLQYATDVGSHITDFYRNYFDVEYPLPKLDMAAIPDYSSGATEHWGMITYRETNLIYDPSESSSSNQRRVANVIAHELAHQWFGNLMTVKWWNDLWLNEGFASYIQYKGAKSFETDWDMDSLFLTDDLYRVFDLDATLSSHSIVVDVDTPDQITAVFDTIAYSKGASVIRMMENFMGEKDFQLGIHNFLVKYQFQNAITQDLFDELTAVSSDGLEITNIMDTWTRQKGYPLVTLRKESGQYKITQKRFLTDPDAYDNPNETSPYDFKWEIPVTYISSEDSTPKQVWFHKDDESISIDIPTGTMWVKFNVGQYGYYRVNYPQEDWNTLSQTLIDSPQTFSISDRTSLISDAFALASASVLDYPTALNMTKYLKGERDLTPWNVALSALGYLSNVLYYTPTYPNLAKYKRQLIQPLYEELTWTDDGTIDNRLLRVSIHDQACGLGIEDCLDTAGQMFTDWMDNNQTIPPNFRSLVYKYGMKTRGNQNTWDWMLARYKAEKNAQEKSKLMTGLAYIQDPEILYNFIQIAKDESVVRSQDYLSMLNIISGNRVGEPIVWDFFRNEWEYLVDRFTLNDRYLGKLIAQITDRFSTQQRLKEMQDFFIQYPEAGAGESSRKIALETVQNNIKFLETYSDVIDQWLNDNARNQKEQ